VVYTISSPKLTTTQKVSDQTFCAGEEGFQTTKQIVDFDRGGRQLCHWSP